MKETDRPENTDKICRILFVTGILLLISELWKQWMINGVLRVVPGGYDWWFFPFQLCSTPMYVCLLFPLLKKREGLRGAALTYLSTFGLLGGIFAFFDTSGFTELGCFPLAVHSYVWHILMILMGVLCFIWLARRERGNFFGAAGIFLAGCVIAEIINFAVGDRGIINMFYINPRFKMAQICFSDIAEYLGNGWGVCVYIIAIIIGAATLYIALLALSSVRDHQSESQSVPPESQSEPESQPESKSQLRS